jgi:ABC-type transport system involved in multi-copper enzyme maturation permease subunit
MAGLALACLLAALSVQFLLGTGELDRQFPPARGGHFAAIVAGQLPGTTWYVAMLWAAVVGSGVFAAELEPRLAGFWRSRPISPSAWYWVKFIVGLIAVIGVLDGVTILVSWNSPYGHSPSQMSLSYVACMPVLHATMYSLAVLGVCLLRRPVAGATAAVLAFFLVTLVFESVAPGRFGGQFEPMSVYNALYYAEEKGEFDLTLYYYIYYYIPVYGTLTLVIVAAAVLGRFASLRR